MGVKISQDTMPDAIMVAGEAGIEYQVWTCDNCGRVTGNHALVDSADHVICQTCAADAVWAVLGAWRSTRPGP